MPIGQQTFTLHSHEEGSSQANTFAPACLKALNSSCDMLSVWRYVLVGLGSFPIIPQELASP